MVNNKKDKNNKPRRSKRLENKKRKKELSDSEELSEENVSDSEELSEENVSDSEELSEENVSDPEIKKRKYGQDMIFFMFPDSFILPELKRLKANEDIPNQNSVPDKESTELENTNENLIYFGPELYKTKTTRIVKFNKIFTRLEELIQLGEQYDPSIIYECNIDIRKLYNIVYPLKELNSMIGLNKFKTNIIDQLIYILTTDFTNTSEIPMLHSCIYGSPGTGKTSVCKILGKIYAKCGLLSKGDLIVTKREDFVGEFLGSTTIKTQKLLERSKGSVLFIDEVYSFGSDKSTNNDSFAKEAVDALNLFLSENYKDFICIIAGYKEDVDKCFFAVNQGLQRRFTNKYTIDGYNSDELKEIFLKFISDEGWKTNILDHTLSDFFDTHKLSFPYYGGDIKTLLDKCKITHSRKIVMMDKSLWKVLNYDDINEGFLCYLEERQVVKEDNSYITSMYL